MNNHAHVLKGKSGITANPFVMHFLNTFDYHGYVTGTTRAKLNQSRMRDIPIRLAPFPEQHRIVAKIEELFSRLDAGMEALKQVQAQLKQYRQAVLKSAVEGKLTAQWREGHKGELEPASELRKRILKERREKWEGKQIARYEAKGQKPPQDWREKYKEPARPDTSNLPELPEGWVWATVELCSNWANGKGLTKQEMEEGEYFVFGGHGIAGKHSKYLVEEGSIVIGRVGAHCGNVTIAPEKSWITDNAIYSTWSSSYVEARFLAQVLVNMNLNQISGGSGQPYVSQALLNPLLVALPSKDEQLKIVEILEQLLSISGQAKESIEMEFIRGDALRKAILGRAFGGKLVPQDPECEPAEVLLERIKEEKAKREGKGKQMVLGA